MPKIIKTSDSPDLLDLPSISSQVRQMRHHFGDTQIKFAERVGVDQSTISRWESGVVPEGEQLQLLQKLLKSMETPVHSTAWGTPEEETVEIIGHVQAGDWRASIEWPPSDRLTLRLPPDKRFPGIQRIGLQVRGDSMDLIYPENTIIVAVPTVANSIEPRSGNKVIVQRRDSHGLYESTVKEFFVDAGGRPRLMPRSSKKEHRDSLPIPDPAGMEDTDDILISGLVTGSYRLE